QTGSAPCLAIFCLLKLKPAPNFICFHLQITCKNLALFLFQLLFTDAQLVPPTSDENVTVTETEFNGVPVRLYLPRRAPGGLRRAMVYIHGGGWCLGDAGMQGYDLMARHISNELNAVVVSTNYRLAPPHHFPAQFEDVYSVTKFFLQSKVLAQYGVDPARVCVAGDSAGGNLAAAVAQELLEDPEVQTQLKAQVLIYPALQALDLDLPSYRDNAHKPALEARLRRLPAAFVLTCEHDVLRDDGAMYVGRLRAAGVPVTHHHAKDGFHGAFSFLAWPLDLALSHRLLSTCVGWLRENL
uniref:Arylacetamide deacetylase n=1 Tax=Ficedula albicollis TaxID=59894 RepID=A0A803W644_FICAL